MTPTIEYFQSILPLVSAASFLSGLWAAMTKSYEFNWQKHLPVFMQEGASFDRFDEVRRGLRHLKCCAIFSVLLSPPTLKDHSSKTTHPAEPFLFFFFSLIVWVLAVGGAHRSILIKNLQHGNCKADLWKRHMCLLSLGECVTHTHRCRGQ